MTTRKYTTELAKLPLTELALRQHPTRVSARIGIIYDLWHWHEKYIPDKDNEEAKKPLYPPAIPRPEPVLDSSELLTGYATQFINGATTREFDCDLDIQAMLSIHYYRSRYFGTSSETELRENYNDGWKDD